MKKIGIFFIAAAAIAFSAQSVPAQQAPAPVVKAVLLHNAREEIEHASMVLEWIRRREPVFDKNLREYLFSEGPITEVEHRVMQKPK